MYAKNVDTKCFQFLFTDYVADVIFCAGCIAVLANGILAIIFNQEALRLQDIMGASFAIVGGFLIIQFSTQADDILNAQQILHHLGGWQFIIYMFVQVCKSLVVAV